MGVYSVAQDVKKHTKESFSFFKEKHFFLASTESLSIAFTPSPSYTNAEKSVDWKRQRRGRMGEVGRGLAGKGGGEGAMGSGVATIAANDMKWRRQPCAHGRLQSRPLALRFKVPPSAARG